MKRSKIKYLVRLIDQHGIEVLDKDKNRYYSAEFKLEIINRILVDHESINSVAIELGLSSDGTIHSWIKKYKENGYNVIEKKRGRVPMTKPKKASMDDLTPEEKVKELEKRLQYVEAENEYLKKLNVVVKQRVEREKKKKQK
jgi:Transposase and inactivated derivatives